MSKKEGKANWAAVKIQLNQVTIEGHECLKKEGKVNWAAVTMAHLAHCPPREPCH